jgi:hypothetical protein
MITLYQVEHLPLEDLERLAYAADDNCPTTIKMVRALAHRAVKARVEDADRIRELEAENTALEVEISEMRETD